MLYGKQSTLFGKVAPWTGCSWPLGGRGAPVAGCSRTTLLRALACVNVRACTQHTCMPGMPGVGKSLIMPFIVCPSGSPVTWSPPPLERYVLLVAVHHGLLALRPLAPSHFPASPTSLPSCRMALEHAKRDNAAAKNELESYIIKMRNAFMGEDEQLLKVLCACSCTCLPACVCHFVCAHVPVFSCMWVLGQNGADVQGALHPHACTPGRTCACMHVVQRINQVNQTQMQCPTCTHVCAGDDRGAAHQLCGRTARGGGLAV